MDSRQFGIAAAVIGIDGAVRPAVVENRRPELQSPVRSKSYLYSALQARRPGLGASTKLPTGSP